MEQKYSVLKVEQQFKKPIIQFQSLIQAKTGKYISQGRAASLACSYLMILLDELPTQFREQGDDKMALAFTRLKERLLDISERFAEGSLEDFDIENIFDYS